MVTFTANQLFGRDLHIAHQTATGRTLFCKGTTALQGQQHLVMYSMVSKQKTLKLLRYLFFLPLVLAYWLSWGVLSWTSGELYTHWSSAESLPDQNQRCHDPIGKIISVLIFPLWNIEPSSGCLRLICNELHRITLSIFYSPPTHQGRFCASWPGRSRAESAP